MHITETRSGDDIVVSNELGESYTFKGQGHRSLLLDIDPRIDLTAPIYEQVAKLAAEDKAVEERASERKGQARVA